jgi:hypothetical protein
MTKHCESVSREDKTETVIARLIANTRRRKRPDNLVEIAYYIRRAEKDLGSLKAVAETIGLSTDQLWQFLSVERLCPEVRKLVEERKIDLVNIVHYMRNFDAEAQQVIAEEVVAGRLSGKDIRVLAPLQKSLPNLSIDELISRVQKSRDVKVYVAYFRVPPGLEDADALERRFGRIVGQSEIVSFTVEDQIGILKLTPSGRKKLQEATKERSVSLRKFVDAIVLE